MSGGPIILFDKSFLQSLSVDEAVWFDHFFMTVISPMFYVETLADLSKKFKDSRDPKNEVSLIANKTPQMHSYPCVFHVPMVIESLYGNNPPMNGRVPLKGGKPYKDGKSFGVTYKESPEAEALLRWAKGEFQEVEHHYASTWRSIVQNADFQLSTTDLEKMGVPVNTANTLEEIRALVNDIVSNPKLTGGHIQTILALFNETKHTVAIVRRWTDMKCPPLNIFAPYAAFFLEIELFFLLAVNKKLISSNRKSNKTDISYLYYLPFCMAFISTDKLHKRCAPLFLRKNQQFIWGDEMKYSLKKTDNHFKEYPQEIKEKGLNVIAPAPPVCFESEITRLFDLYCRNDWRTITSSISTDPKKRTGKEIVDEMKAKANLPEISSEEVKKLGEANSMTFERMISKGRGNWYQLPKDIEKKNDTNK